MTRFAGILVVLMGVAALSAGSAAAATVDEFSDSSGSYIQFSAGPGEINHITVMGNGATVSFQADVGNTGLLSGGVVCTTTAVGADCPTGGVSRIVVNLGDLDDVMAIKCGLGSANLCAPGPLALSVDGGSGNDVLASAASPTSLAGGDGNDTLNACTQTDCFGTSIDGGAGDDVITGGPGPDSLVGGPDDDTITAGAGDDVVDGGDGNDHIDGGIGEDQLTGGAGDDVINGAGGNDVEHGGDGNDRLGEQELAIQDSGDDQFFGDAGNDTILPGAGDDTVDGGDGDDTFIDPVDDHSPSPVAGRANDVTFSGNDDYVGGPGNDTMDYSDAFFPVEVTLSEPGAGPADLGSGDDGRFNDDPARGPIDTLENDDVAGDIEHVIGTAYGDELIGNSASNVLDGGKGGSDWIDGGGGTDTLIGGPPLGSGADRDRLIGAEPAGTPAAVDTLTCGSATGVALVDSADTASGCRVVHDVNSPVIDLKKLRYRTSGSIKTLAVAASCAFGPGCHSRVTVTGLLGGRRVTLVSNRVISIQSASSRTTHLRLVKGVAKLLAGHAHVTVSLRLVSTDGRGHTATTSLRGTASHG